MNDTIRAAAKRLADRDLADYQGSSDDDMDMRAGIVLARFALALAMTEWTIETPTVRMDFEEVFYWWRTEPSKRAMMCKLVAVTGARFQVHCDDLPRIRGPRYADEMGGQWLKIERPPPLASP